MLYIHSLLLIILITFCPAARYGLSDQYESRRKGTRSLGTSNVSQSYITGLFGYVSRCPFGSIFPMIFNYAVGVEAMLGGRFIADWGDDGTLWEAWRRTCTPQSSARRLFSSIRGPSSAQSKNHFSSTMNPGSDFYFAKGTSSKQDFCDVPHAHYTQGHFFSDWRSIPVLYPVFSPAKAQGFMDIRIPSHYYYGSTRRYTYGWDPVNLELRSFDQMEVPWEYKIDKVFWRGATTGGGSHPPGFAPYYQRHRCV